MLIKPCWANILGCYLEHRLTLALVQTGFCLLQQSNNSSQDRGCSRGTVITIVVTGKMANRTKIRFIGIQRSRSLAAVADKLFILVDRAYGHHQRMAIGTPNTFSRSGIGSALT